MVVVVSDVVVGYDVVVLQIIVADYGVLSCGQ